MKDNFLIKKLSWFCILFKIQCVYFMKNKKKSKLHYITLYETFEQPAPFCKKITISKWYYLHKMHIFFVNQENADIGNHSVTGGKEERFRTSRNDNRKDSKGSVIPACLPTGRLVGNPSLRHTLPPITEWLQTLLKNWYAEDIWM